ncbi:MAG: NAD(P)H-dependent oxidoreductase [Neisseria sp.]|uniref:NAD(P)H-dependent oxidoreductase n=1 Tax=Neisseria sp. TaxID=192066 RepID=UPI0026DA84E8|nr:NAD(P)H-dependent oxidoreductase [Neisseria sp.]MDO4640281.1 NAD(P)H-dependent oxidoreductase [Neisseria sp.]
MRILLLDGGAAFGPSQGRLNHTLQACARDTLVGLGHEVCETVLADEYDPQEEVGKFLWMDAVIWQMPAWWMGEPWFIKAYIDKVFSAGLGKLWQSDGRHSATPTEGYGTGGLLQGKKHMLSLTWNAPMEAFTRPGDFFEGVGVDAVYLHFHKANEFLGLQALPTFICSDVVKNPQVERYLKDYRAHLQEIFAA